MKEVGGFIIIITDFIRNAHEFLVIFTNPISNIHYILKVFNLWYNNKYSNTSKKT